MFNTELFIRTPRGMRPNELGRCVTRYARLICTDVTHLREEMEGILQGTGGRLAIGTIMGAISGVLADALTRMRRKHPELRVEVVEDISARLLPLLDQGRLDLAICRTTVAQLPEHYESRALRDEPLAVIAGPDHPLANEERLSLSDLTASGWIVYPSNLPVRNLYEREFQDAGLPLPRHQVETASIMTMVLLMQRNPDLVAMVPLDMAKTFARHGMVTRLSVQIRSKSEPYGIVTRRGIAPSAAAVLAINELVAGI